MEAHRCISGHRHVTRPLNEAPCRSSKLTGAQTVLGMSRGLNALSTHCRVARMERESRDSAGRCAQLEKEFPWIAGEKQLFGYAAQPDSPASPMPLHADDASPAAHHKSVTNPAALARTATVTVMIGQ